MSFARGLVVGKFCPLHRGHQLVIDRALSECREVVLISYAKPGYPGYGRAQREAWLAWLYPATRRLVVDDDWLAAYAGSHHDARYTLLPPDAAPAEIHRDFCAWLCWDVLGLPVDAVFTSEDYGEGFAEALTAYFRQRVPVAPPVRHVMVDRARQAVPISGTRLRADPAARRSFVDERVRAGLVERIGILGGESSGKSSLAAALAAHLGQAFDAEQAFVAEYGRELWEEQGGELAYGDLLKIARTQVRREEEACFRAERWLFCDTTPLTTWFYCLEMFGRAEPELEALANRPYHRLFLCAPDFDFVQDGTRRDADFRARQHAWYQAELARRGLAYEIIGGALAERVASVAQHLV